MQIHRRAGLDGPIAIPASLQTCRVGEEACRDGFLDGDGVRAARGRGDFDAVAELRELVAHVARAGQAALLQEVHLGPDVGEVGVDPLVPDVEEG